MIVSGFKNVDIQQLCSHSQQTTLLYDFDFPFWRQCGTPTLTMPLSINFPPHEMLSRLILIVTKQSFLLVLVGVFHPTWEFFSPMKTCWLRTANLDLYSALMAIEQWWLFSVPHLLWQGASVYNGHLRGHVTLEPVAERIAVALEIRTPNLPHTIWTVLPNALPTRKHKKLL